MLLSGETLFIPSNSECKNVFDLPSDVDLYQFACNAYNSSLCLYLNDCRKRKVIKTPNAGLYLIEKSINSNQLAMCHNDVNKMYAKCASKLVNANSSVTAIFDIETEAKVGCEMVSYALAVKVGDNVIKKYYGCDSIEYMINYIFDGS